VPAHSKPECNGAVFWGFDALIERKLLERVMGRLDREPFPILFLMPGETTVSSASRCHHSGEVERSTQETNRPGDREAITAMWI
jgi:hypothetical protein